MISDKDLDDAVRYTKDPLYKWKDYEFTQTKDLLIAQQARFDFKIVVGICTYNDGDFILDTLNSCLNFVDLDGIHIMDGAWVHGGATAMSSDNTIASVNEWSKQHGNIKVTLEYNSPKDEFWRTQGDKRNAQLKSIEEIYGKTYVFILDSDEIIETNSGQVRHWMKHELSGRAPNMGMVRAYGNGSKAYLDTPRLIPVGHPYNYDYHYHTEQRMVIHDDDHHIICNYERNECEKSRAHLWDFNNFRIINRWNKRSWDRQTEKQIYVNKIPANNEGKCKWIK